MILKQYKITLIVLCLVISVGIIGMGVFALFTDRASSMIEGIAGDVHVRLVEDFPLTTEMGAATETKVFRGVSLGSKRTYVRASVFPIIEYLYTGIDPETGESVHEWRPVTSIPVSAVKYDIVPNPDWIYFDDGGGDGYWYYAKILRTGEETTDFEIINIHLDEDELSPETVGQRLRINLKVRLDSTQATHELYKKNFNISDLPPGVERISAGDADE